MIYLVRVLAWEPCGYEEFRSGRPMGRIVEQVRIEVWLAIPWVVEISWIRAVNAIVLENVGETISSDAWLEVLVMIEALDASLTGTLY